ncbi:toprim domain-containing protein [Bacteroides sp. 224]|uniref:toprim domain-containing protein n=1 Tax=Bacteroides sp. 224 TaxID=2302936 RepID=UPI0013D2CABA|nr:toprim domain-containing protein [Bacteroides sp. 224]NDV64832.1 hypothetical protein [Bacteroides sp. 224]
MSCICDRNRFLNSKACAIFRNTLVFRRSFIEFLFETGSEIFGIIKASNSKHYKESIHNRRYNIVTIEPIKKYEVIHCYLDNDDAGRRVVDTLQELLGGKVQNIFAAYPLYKDLNDFLRDKKKIP